MSTKSGRSKKSSFNAFSLGFRVLGQTPARLFPFSSKIRANLLRACIRINHVVYVSAMFFWSICAFVVGFAASFFFVSVIPSAVVVAFPSSSIVFAFLIGVLAFVVTLATFMYYPNYRASALTTKIDKNLVYSANYMAVLASAGATPGETFSSFLGVGKIFGLEESARSIVKNIELLGQDMITVLDEESKRTPSKDYSEFLQGYIATVQTGGNMEAYLLVMSHKFMETRRRMLRKMIEQLGLAGEMYVGIMIAFPLIIVTLLSIMGFFGGDVIGGLSAGQAMPLVVYFLVPLMGAGVLIFIDTTMSRWWT